VSDLETMLRPYVLREPTRGKNGPLPYYVDVKAAIGDPYVLRTIVDALVPRCAMAISTVVACGYGGVPIAAAFCDKSGRYLTMIREKPKNHGKGGMVDGHVPTKGEFVMLFDDVTTTGQTFREMEKVIAPFGVLVGARVVVVNRGGVKGIESLTSIKKIEPHGADGPTGEEA
jgi:orotate phosphoribosyltransferase